MGIFILVRRYLYIETVPGAILRLHYFCEVISNDMNEYATFIHQEITV